MLKAIPESYKSTCDHPGTLEALEIPGFSNATVYLPYGYSDKQRYSTFYLLHGGGGDEHSFFSNDGELKNMLDHMIDRGELDPLIVIAPTYYAPGDRDKGIAHSADAVRDFGPILLKKIVPLVDQTYSTMPDRKHRGIGGFSMGGVATWYVLMAGTDQFHWFMPLSGDCWICGETGGGKHTKQTVSLLATALQGKDYYLHALTGDKDIAYPNLDPQMKEMENNQDIFGAKIHYSVLKDGVHDYPDIRRYIYNALPEFFRG